MRYYELSLTPKGSKTPYRTFGTNPNGQYDPGALNVSFDIPIASYDATVGGATISIQGVPLQDLNQAQNFVGMSMILRAGMTAGLPLANPKQAGLILTADVFQSYGNWEGTEQTLDLVVLASTYTEENPGNIVLHWQAGQPLSEALQNTLQVAYPQYPISMNISKSLINTHDQVGHWSTLGGLADFVSGFTQDAFKNRVDITIQAGQLLVFDKTYQPPPIQLVFTDLIGQPTWIKPLQIQIKTVMRADLQIGSIVRMPEGMKNGAGFVRQTADAAGSVVKYKSTFSGDFTITELRHIGDLRSPDGSSWCSIFNCVPNDPEG